MPVQKKFFLVFKKSCCLLLFVVVNLVHAQTTPFATAKMFFEKKNYTAAKTILEDFLKNNPNHLPAIELLGDVAGATNKWDVALRYYERLKAEKPNSAEYQFKYGAALGMKAKSISKWKAVGLVDDVEDAFLKSAQLDKSNVETRWALVMLYLELPAIIGGSEAKSQKYAQELMNISKVDGYLARAYIDNYFKRTQKAENNYKKAFEIGKSPVTFQKLYDFYTQQLKDKEKALALKTEFDRLKK